ncbi:MAG: hypothetical protein JSU01_20745 [Bacteroidetes bacterium]|nr:hypothetical protein [Bacteroidota bacterium]
MHYKFNNSDTEIDTSFLQHATLWGPDADDEVEPSSDDADWDEAEEYIDDEPNEEEDDRREIQVDDDIREPDLDERFPEEDD